MQSFASFARADWGPALRAAAGRVAYVVAVLIVAAELAYRAGLATGRAVHWLSDRLAGLASGRIDRAQTARAIVAWAHAVLTPAPAPAPEPEPSIAETFAAVAAAAAASDARLYRSAGESIARIRATLDAAETEPALVEAEQSPRMYQRVTLAKGGGHRHEWLPVTMACAATPVASPSVAVAPPALDTLTVADLRRLARARGLSGLARKGRRADLLAALTD